MACFEWLRNFWRCHLRGASALGTPLAVHVPEAPRFLTEGRTVGPQRCVLAQAGQEHDPDPSDAELREVLEESLRTAEADRCFQQALSLAILRSMDDASLTTASSSQDAQASETSSDGAAKCVICLDLKQPGVMCCPDQPSKVHFVCADCLPHYVRSELESDETSSRRLMESRRSGHCLCCPNRPDCKGFLELEATRPFVSAELWSRLQATAEADENHRRWEDELGAEDDQQERRREALLCAYPNAVQCGGCGYGPIDHIGCADLDAHHGEWRGASRISNQCPRCGWRQHSISQWPRWEGVLDL